MTVESLTPITDEALLAEVKKAVGNTGTYQDDTIQFYINDVKVDLLSAGVRADVVNSTLAVGCIARGVTDMWLPVAGAAKYSETFFQKADALRGVKVVGE